MKFKKLLVVGLTLSLIAACFAGCNKETNGVENAKGKKDMPTIGIVQIVEHQSLDMIRENILKQLEAEGFKDGETVNLKYENAQNDTNNLKTICQGFSAEKVDLIIAIATPSAQTALGETKEIPIVFSAVTDPVGAGLVRSMEKPGGNITGTSDAVSATKIMDFAQKLTPGIKKIGAIYSTGEPNSVSVIEELKEYAKKNGMQIKEATIMNSSEVKQAADSLVGKVDAVFSPIDNTVATAMPTIVDVLNKAKIPFYVSADTMVADGGLATDGVNYVELGVETGKMAANVLNGEATSDMPVKVLEKTQIYVNTKTAKSIGVEIPKEIMENAKDLSEGI